MASILKINFLHPNGSEMKMDIDLERSEHISFGFDKNLDLVMHAPGLRDGTLRVVTSLQEIDTQIISLRKSMKKKRIINKQK